MIVAVAVVVTPLETSFLLHKLLLEGGSKNLEGGLENGIPGGV